MRVPLAVMLVLAVRLVLATASAAQVAEDEPVPDPIPPRVEFGAGGGLVVAYPEVGVLASVPTGSGPDCSPYFRPSSSSIRASRAARAASAPWSVGS